MQIQRKTRKAVTKLIFLELQKTLQKLEHNESNNIMVCQRAVQFECAHLT